MKKSKAITLVLLTSSLFLGCEDKVRNQYASWDDCVKDYRDSSKCESETDQSSGVTHTRYYGPWYACQDHPAIASTLQASQEGPSELPGEVSEEAASHGSS